MAAKIMILALTICCFGSLTLGASVKGKIEKLDNVIRDLEREVEVLAELKDEGSKVKKVKKVVLVKGKNIIEANKEDGTDQWIQTFCKTHDCEEEGGDTIMSKKQKAIEKKDNEIAAGTSNDPIKPAASHWKKVNGRVVVPYAFADSVDENTKNVIKEAIEEYKTKSCVDWTPVENSATTYHVEFIKGSGCYSYVGLASGFLSGKQPISIGNGCAYKGTVIHEMLHCMGFFHEQSRPDRDDYVKIQLGNLIDQKFANNFAKQSAAMVDSQGVGYDINSVMHYGPTYFAKQGTYTILKKVAGGDPVVFSANRAGFSDKDLIQLNAMYQCAAAPVATVAPTEVPTEAPTTEAPKTYDGTCLMMIDLGFCGYPMIKDNCAGCANNNGEGLISNLYDAAKCEKWAKKGYCNEENKYNQWMFGNCLKQCIETNYPAEQLTSHFG